jgi:MYXO-CTERM domain-containing protein
MVDVLGLILCIVVHAANIQGLESAPAGVIWFASNSDLYKNTVYLKNTDEVFNLLPQVPTNGKTAVKLGEVADLEVGVDFFVSYNQGNWNDFLDIVFSKDSPFGFEVYIGSLGDGARYPTQFDSTNPQTATPEQATLAVLGLGLAGVGLASRRRRK